MEEKEKELDMNISRLSLEERGAVLGVALYLKRNMDKDGIKVNNESDLLELLLDKYIKNEVIEYFQTNILVNVELSTLAFKLLSVKEEFIINEIVRNDDYYNSNNYSTPIEINRFVKRYVELTEVGDVLDMFSGTGSFEMELGNTLLNVTGYDISNTAVNYAKLRKYAISSKIYDNVFINLNFERKNILQESIPNQYSFIFADVPAINVYPTEVLKFVNSEIKSLGISINENRRINMSWIASLLALSKLYNTFGFGEAKAVITCFNSALSNVIDKDVRKLLIDNNYIEEIIALPDNILPYTSNQLNLIVLSKDKKEKEIKFIDYTKMYKAERRRNVFDYETALRKKNECTSIMSIDNIIENDYSLNPVYYKEGETIEIQNSICLKDIAIDIYRGYQITGAQADKMIVNNIDNANYQILEVSNIDDNGYIFQDLKAINSDGKNLDRYLLKNGDIVLSARGDKVKKCLIEIEDSERIIPNGSLNVIRINQEKILPAYLKIFLESEKGIILINRLKTGNVIPVINTGALEKMIIPCPPIKEQLKIVDEYNSKNELIKLTEHRLLKLKDDLKLFINNV